jgi:hypothetical protein
MPLELQMLQVVIVACQIEIDLVLTKQWVPIADQYRVISMFSVRVDRVMSHDHKERCGAGTLELCFQPCKLICLLLRRHGKEAPVRQATILEGHIAVERQKRNQGLLGW